MNIKPITPHLGAFVDGVVITAKMETGDLAAIKSALDRHLVLVFKNQRLSAAELRDFTENFGPLFVHHADEGVLFADGIPEVLEMRKEPSGERLFGGGDWHADVTFEKPEGYVSVLHALVVPEVGGDTGFASTIAAFNALSHAMQAMLRDLEAVHSYDGVDNPESTKHSAIHPVVRKHPQTGAEGLYINKMFTTQFTDMTREESRPLIDFLDTHMQQPEFTCRISWQKGQVVMWDNRFTLHYPINDFINQARLLIRCTALDKS